MAEEAGIAELRRLIDEQKAKIAALEDGNKSPFLPAAIGGIIGAVLAVGGYALFFQPAAPDLSDVVRTADLPDTSGLAASADLPDFTAFALKSDLDGLAAAADLDALATKEELPDLTGYVTADALPDFSAFATRDEIPDVSGFATADDVAVVADALQDYAPLSAIPDVSAFITADALDGFVRAENLPRLPDFSNYLQYGDPVTLELSSRRGHFLQSASPNDPGVTVDTGGLPRRTWVLREAGR